LNLIILIVFNQFLLPQLKSFNFLLPQATNRSRAYVHSHYKTVFAEHTVQCSLIIY